MAIGELLERCAANHRSGHVSAVVQTLLRQWNAESERHTDGFALRLLDTDARHWDEVVTGHDAHRHYWYDFVQDEITIDEMAVFLLENVHYPSFLKMLERIRDEIGESTEVSDLLHFIESSSRGVTK